MMEKGSGGDANKRTREEQRRRDTMQAYAVIFGVLIAIMAITVYIMFLKKDVKTAETVQNNTSQSESIDAGDADEGSIPGIRAVSLKYWSLIYISEQFLVVRKVGGG